MRHVHRWDRIIREIVERGGTVRSVADYCGCSAVTIYRLAADPRREPGYRIGALLLDLLAEVRRRRPGPLRARPPAEIRPALYHF